MKLSATILVLFLVTLVTMSCSRAENETGSGGSAPEQATLSIDAPTFVAIDQNGSEFSTEDVKGKPWIASFFFTSCSTVCPRLNEVQKGLQEEFGNEIRFVSISTDPDNDDVPALKAYATEYGAEDGTWWMVRLPHDEMRNLASDGFKLIDPEDPAMHSTRFVAVNAEMTIEGFFDSEDADDVEELKSWMRSQR